MGVVLEKGRTARDGAEYVVGKVILGGQRLHGYGARAVLLDDAVEAGRDVIQRVIPRDSFPFAGATLADPALRVDHPLGRIGYIQGGFALDAEETFAQRVFFVANESSDLAILDVNDHAAAYEAEPTSSINGRHHAIESRNAIKPSPR